MGRPSTGWHTSATISIWGADQALHISEPRFEFVIR